jgi:hypothetical protein
MESSRKRRKTEGNSSTPSKTCIFHSEIVKAERLVQGSTPVGFQTGRVYTSPSERHVSSPNPGPSNSLYLGPRCKHGYLVHVVPRSTAPVFTDQQLFTIPWFAQGRFVEEPQQIGSVMEHFSERGKPFDSSFDIQLLPRAHIRSRSEASGSHSTTQLDRGTPQNSISTVTTAIQNTSINWVPPSITNSSWSTNPTQRPCEELAADSPNEGAPLLSNIRQPAPQRDAVGRPKSSDQQTTAEERHEIFHIDKYKCLWCVAISIFVGIFLCLFLYAFHIVK